MCQIMSIPRSIALTFFFSILLPQSIFAQSTDVSTEYLMTLHAPLHAPQPIDGSLQIYGVAEGGWVKGPKIEGELIAPAGDWLQVLSDGTLKLDVRLTLETDDGALIYVSYSGIALHNKLSLAKAISGDEIKSNEMYFVTAPTMRTSSEKYSWLNHVQCVGKMTRLKTGEGAFVEYDIFIVR